MNQKSGELARKIIDLDEKWRSHSMSKIRSIIIFDWNDFYLKNLITVMGHYSSPMLMEKKRRSPISTLDEIITLL